MVVRVTDDLLTRVFGPPADDIHLPPINKALRIPVHDCTYTWEVYAGALWAYCTTCGAIPPERES